MTYRINVAQSVGRNWNDTGEDYKHHFAVNLDYCEDARKVVTELQGFYPAPKYNITLKCTISTSHNVWLD